MVVVFNGLIGLNKYFLVGVNQKVIKICDWKLLCFFKFKIVN